jgi:hypothetical protein
MPHLEEQFPPVNPLVLQRPDALDPPDREEEEETRPVESRVEDETPLPGTLANGIDRVTLSANARLIIPVQPLEETVPLPVESDVNPEVPELLDIETQRREVEGLDPTDIGFPAITSLQNFVNALEPEARAENIPFVVQGPLNVPPPAVEDAVAVVPAVQGSVAALDDNSQALRRDNLGTDPALRSNRELRNILQEFNAQIEPPEEVTEPAGGPITEVQNNAPPSPAVFENLEALSAELLNDLREQQAREGVTRPEEERTAPPEPRTPESVMTERGQNIDRFI